MGDLIRNIVAEIDSSREQMFRILESIAVLEINRDAKKFNVEKFKHSSEKKREKDIISSSKPNFNNKDKDTKDKNKNGGNEDQNNTSIDKNINLLSSSNSKDKLQSGNRLSGGSVSMQTTLSNLK